MKKVINCLYSFLRNTTKKLKVVCDWDEVIQPHEPFSLYLALEKIKIPIGLEKFIEKFNKEKIKKEIFNLCSQIPKGKVSTYSLISNKLQGNYLLSRYVGNVLSECECQRNNNICKKNNCHRVIRTNFSVAGFLGNKKEKNNTKKKRKLESEGIIIDEKGFVKKELRKDIIFKDFKFDENKEDISIFFDFFWDNKLVDYSKFGSKLARKIPEQITIKNSPDFYKKAPFLTLAKELLMLINEEKVEVFFLSAYDKEIFKNGDQRKKEIFEKTFGKKNSCSLNLVEFSKKGTGKKKISWIIENVSDVDIIIDDNPNILNDCLNTNPGIVLFSPYYPSIKHNEKVNLIKNSISNLKIEDF